MPDIITQWKVGRRKSESGRKGKCFLVPADEIRKNKYDLSISRYKEIEHKEVAYAKPEVITANVQRLERGIDGLVDEIGQMISNGGRGKSEGEM